MIVAGLGFTSTATADDIDATLDAAARAYGIARADIARLATLDRKAHTLSDYVHVRHPARSEAAARPSKMRDPANDERSAKDGLEAAPRLMLGPGQGSALRARPSGMTEVGITIDAISMADLAPFAGRCLSRSEVSLRETGVPSLAEASALCGAERATGLRARLLGPRIATERATCALATTLPEISS